MEMMIEYHDKRVKEIWELFAATDRELKSLGQETERKLATLSDVGKETELKLASYIESGKMTDKKLAKLSDKVHEITDQWGRFVENFLLPGLSKVFQERGFPIRSTHPRAKASLNGDNMEIDIIAVNSSYAVLVEAKNLLKVDHVKRHLSKLPRFKTFFPEYHDKKILGAVASIEFASDSDSYAIAEGLFVITLGNDTVRITNPNEFTPKTW
jgi:hypothetical protein